jgi:hypothetical protein
VRAFLPSNPKNITDSTHRSDSLAQCDAMLLLPHSMDPTHPLLTPSSPATPNSLLSRPMYAPP